MDYNSRENGGYTDPEYRDAIYIGAEPSYAQGLQHGLRMPPETPAPLAPNSEQGSPTSTEQILNPEN